MLRWALLLALSTGASSFQTHDVEMALQAALRWQLLGRQNSNGTSQSLDSSVLDKQRCKSLPAPEDELEQLLAGIAKGVAGFECPSANGCDGSGVDKDDKGDGDDSGDLEDDDGGNKGDGDGPGKGGDPGTFHCDKLKDAEHRKRCKRLHKGKIKACIKHAFEGKPWRSMKSCSRDFGGLLRPYGKDALGGFLIETLKPLLKDRGGDNSSPGREIGKLVRAKIRTYYDFYLFVLGFIDGRNAAIDKNEKGKDARDIYNIGYGIGYSIYRPITDIEVEKNPATMIDIYGTLFMHFGFNDKHVPMSTEDGGGKMENKVLKKLEYEIKRLILNGDIPKYSTADFENEVLLTEILLMFFEASRLLHVDGHSKLDKTLANIGKWFGEVIRDLHHYRFSGANPVFWIIGLFDGVEDGKVAPVHSDVNGIRYKPLYIGVKGRPLHKERTMAYKAGYRIGIGLAIGFRGDGGSASFATKRHPNGAHVFYSNAGSNNSVRHHYGRHSKIDIYVYEDEDEESLKDDDDLDMSMKQEIDRMCKKVKGDNLEDKKCLWNSHYLCMSQELRKKRDPYCPVRLVDSCQAAIPVYLLVYAYQVPSDNQWDEANCFLLINGDTTRLRATESWNNKRRFVIPDMQRSYLKKQTTLTVNGFKNSGCTYRIDEAC